MTTIKTPISGEKVSELVISYDHSRLLVKGLGQPPSHIAFNLVCLAYGMSWGKGCAEIGMFNQ